MGTQPFWLVIESSPAFPSLTAGSKLARLSG
jgi:hypothetical protein